MRLSHLAWSWLAATVLLACSDSTLPAPTSDKNYDDPYDPGSSSGNGVLPEGGGDASGRFCAADRDCPQTHRCVFAIAQTCSAAGQCQPYATVAGCAQNLACGCDGQDVGLCAPDGFSPKPVSHAGPCGSDGGAGDAGAGDAAADAPGD